MGHNEAISVAKEDGAESAKRFARIMPTPPARPTSDEYAKLVLSMNPAVYYRMEEWPKGKDEDTYVLVDSAPGGHHGILHQDRGFGPRAAGQVRQRARSARSGESATTPSSRTIRRPTPVNSPCRPGSGQCLCPDGLYCADRPELDAIRGLRVPRAAANSFFGIDHGEVLLVGVVKSDGSEVCFAEGGRNGKVERISSSTSGSTWPLWPMAPCSACIATALRLAARPCDGVARQPAFKSLGIGGWLDESGARSNCHSELTGTDGSTKLPFSTMRSPPNKCGNCIPGLRPSSAGGQGRDEE